MKKLLFALIASASLHFSANAQDYMFNVEASNLVPNLSVTANTVNINVTTLFGPTPVPGKTAIYPLSGTSFTGVFYTGAFWDLPSGLVSLWLRFGGDGQTITIYNSGTTGRNFYTRVGLAAPLPQQVPSGYKHYNFTVSADYFVAARSSVTVPIPFCSQAYHDNLPFGFVTSLNAGTLALFQILEAL